jgi:hypothetical protein
MRGPSLLGPLIHLVVSALERTPVSAATPSEEGEHRPSGDREEASDRQRRGVARTSTGEVVRTVT